MSVDVPPSSADTGVQSIAEQLRHRDADYTHREAFRSPEGEGWTSLTWQQSKDLAFELAAGLVALGVEPEQRCAIASSTRIEWVLADLAIMCAGAATTTVYPTTKAEDVSYILTDSQSRVVFAEDPEQVAKVLERAGDLSSLLKVVAMTGQAGDDDRVISWEGLRELGRAWLAEHPDGIEQVIAGISKDMLATLIYTSGTT